LTGVTEQSTAVYLTREILVLAAAEHP